MPWEEVGWGSFKKTSMEQSVCSQMKHHCSSINISFAFFTAFKFLFISVSLFSHEHLSSYIFKYKLCGTSHIVGTEDTMIGNFMSLVFKNLRH